METVCVRAYAGFRRYLGGQGQISIPLEPGETVGQLLLRLGFPLQEARIIFVNHRHAELTTELKAGDQIGVFPAIGGG